MTILIKGRQSPNAITFKCQYEYCDQLFQDADHQYRKPKYCSLSCRAKANPPGAKNRLSINKTWTGRKHKDSSIIKMNSVKRPDAYQYLAHKQKYFTPEDKANAKRESNARRKATKLNQTPKYADLKAIKQFYINCPKGHHVDHIMPLCHGGLHDLPNLQYLTAEDNLAKGDKLPHEWEAYKENRNDRSRT